MKSADAEHQTKELRTANSGLLSFFLSGKFCRREGAPEPRFMTFQQVFGYIIQISAVFSAEIKKVRTDR